MRNSNRSQLVALLLGVGVAISGCGGGGDSGSPPPSSSPPPVVAPPPPPPPPPSGGTVLPPLSTTVQDISDEHTIGVAHWGDPQTDGTPIGSFTCIVNPPQDYHVHVHLSIILNNEPLAVPRYIGAAPSGTTHCFYGLHTHDQSGKIHVESTAAGTFTLGQLFEIWKQPLSNTNVAGITGLPIEVFINDGGTVAKVEEADWASIELKSGRQITIALGSSLTEIPVFTW
jgi:hypothetical protein